MNATELESINLCDLEFIGEDGIAGDEAADRYYRMRDGRILRECWGYRDAHEPAALAARLRAESDRDRGSAEALAREGCTADLRRLDALARLAGRIARSPTTTPA